MINTYLSTSISRRRLAISRINQEVEFFIRRGLVPEVHLCDEDFELLDMHTQFLAMNKPTWRHSDLDEKWVIRVYRSNVNYNFIKCGPIEHLLMSYTSREVEADNLNRYNFIKTQYDILSNEEKRWFNQFHRFDKLKPNSNLDEPTKSINGFIQNRINNRNNKILKILS